MPKAQQNTGSQFRLPIRLRRDNIMHEREEAVGVILDLDVNVKLDVLILRLQRTWAKRLDERIGNVSMLTHFHQ
jgi:hypothetical protein